MSLHLPTLALALAPLAPAAVAAPRVAADIAPVQSIAARVMAGIGEPGVILPPGASPHGSRPAAVRGAAAAGGRARGLGRAGAHAVARRPDRDPRARATLPSTLEDAPGVETLRRSAPAGRSSAHDQADHDHRATGTRSRAAPSTPTSGSTRRTPSRPRAPSPRPSAEADPGERRRLPANAEAFAAEMAALRGRSTRASRRCAAGRFLVFHDGYQYFEHALRPARLRQRRAARRRRAGHRADRGDPRPRARRRHGLRLRRAASSSRGCSPP